MSAHTRSQLLRTALILFAMIDLMVLASFVFNQWFAVPVSHALGLAGVLALPVAMLVTPAVDAVLAAAKADGDTGFSGDNIPGTGQ